MNRCHLWKERNSLVQWTSKVLRKRGFSYVAGDLLMVEGKWKERWKKNSGGSFMPHTYHELPNAENKYILSMFPYPSGSLHMGHVRVYTISDALSRYQKLRGHKVLHPMGWDAFGLPAENAAIERNIPPAQWTMSNIEQMRKQFDSLGFLFDWQHELATCNPSYYRWTQWIFLKLYEAGLAYRKEANVNWDPIDQTVLADEQVSQEGISWRSGAKVEQRPLTQWYLRITTFQKELLDGIDLLEKWPPAVREMQKHWIIKEVSYKFRVFDSNGNEHFFIVKDAEDWLWAEVDQLKGPLPLDTKIINPLTLEEIKITEYSPTFELVRGNVKKKQTQLNTTSERVISEYRLRDWLISRQRYWGTPIPIIHCSKCGTLPVPETDLPVLLPIEGINITGKGGSPLSQLTEWVNVTCHVCGGPAKRETDTMDTFMDSSWYFLRFPDSSNNQMIFDPKIISKWLPIEVYSGGIEHAIMHLLYARFIHKFLMKSHGLFGEYSEPFKILITQGLVEGKTFKCPKTGRYLRPHEYDSNGKILLSDKEVGEQAVVVWEKMSKSKWNGIDPIELVNIYGADTLRCCTLFKCPPEFPLRWNTQDIAGSQRWLIRLLNLATKISEMSCNNSSKDEGLNEYMKKIVRDMEMAYDPQNHRLNLAVSNLMKFSNEIQRRVETISKMQLRECMINLALMLHPIAPHQSAEILEILNYQDPLSWPECKLKC